MTYGMGMHLGSIEAVRPVFMIVMGVFLMVIAWRLCKTTEGWTARASSPVRFCWALATP